MLSKRFDRTVDVVLKGFSGRYVFEEVVLISDGNCNEEIVCIQYQGCVQDLIVVEV